MLRRIQTSNLPRSVFVSIGPGESIEKEFDIASTADLAAGGTFGVSSQGIIPFAEGNGTTLTGGAAFRTNHLDLDIDGAVAATVSKAIQPLSRRTEVDGSCSGERKSALLKALRGSASLASSAAKAARSNSKKVQEYFLQDDQETINAVVARLQAIARESGSTTSGATRYYCDDTQNRCEPGVLAYTLPSQNTVTNCPSFYDLPIISKECHAQCQASTVLHELTHNPGVYEPFCEDHAYGYDSIRRLSSRQALNNADSFSLFANGKSRNKTETFKDTNADMYSSHLRRVLSISSQTCFWVLVERDRVRATEHSKDIVHFFNN